MIKRQFGMKCMNITQGRFNNFSHKNLNAYDLAGIDSGIDYFTAFCKLTVIGVFPYNTTGFANTVLFYDAENNVTLAMTHMNTIPPDCKVGKVYESGSVIYKEGTIGKATGNHIHMELGLGRQSSKCKINSKEWGLKNWINIEDYFYVDLDYTKIKNAASYIFDLERKAEDDEMVYFKVLKGTYKTHGKSAIPTRASAFSKYDTEFPVYVGEVIGITGTPISVGGSPCYKIGIGPQKGRYMKFDPFDLRDGYFSMVV